MSELIGRTDITVSRQGQMGLVVNVIGRKNLLVELVGNIGRALKILPYIASSTYFLASDNEIKASYE